MTYHHQHHKIRKAAYLTNRIEFFMQSSSGTWEDVHLKQNNNTPMNKNTKLLKMHILIRSSIIDSGRISKSYYSYCVCTNNNYIHIQ